MPRHESNTPPLDPLLVSEKEARRLLGDCSHSLYWKLINEGKIEVERLGRRTLAKMSSIRRLAGADR